MFVGSLLFVVMEKIFIELFFNGRGSLDYVRNIVKNFDDFELDDLLVEEEDLLEWCVCGNCVFMENFEE